MVFAEIEKLKKEVEARQGDSLQMDTNKTLNKFKRANIVVIGVGGPGGNIVDKIYEILEERGRKDIATLVAVNTDAQALSQIRADHKILIGKNILHGKGTGANPNLGYEAAREDKHLLEPYIQDADIIFIVAGGGGGTGTGASPVIAEYIKDWAARNNRDPVVIAVMTLPFWYEGEERMEVAIAGVQALKGKADTTIVIANDKLLEIAPNFPFNEAMKLPDIMISDMIVGIAETINIPSRFNIDLNDVKNYMRKGPLAILAIGKAKVDNVARKGLYPGREVNPLIRAVEDALNNKLIHIEYEGGTAALVHFTIGPSITLDDLNEGVKAIIQRAGRIRDMKVGVRVVNSAEYERLVEAMIIITGVRLPLLDELLKREVKRKFKFLNAREESPFESSREKKQKLDFLAGIEVV